MAFSHSDITVVQDDQDLTNLSEYLLPSVTLEPGYIYILSITGYDAGEVHVDNAKGVPTLTDVTWAYITHSSTGFLAQQDFRATVASEVTGVITLTFPSIQTGAGWILHKISNVDTSNNGTNAIISFASAAWNGTSGTVTLSPDITTGNLAICSVGCEVPTTFTAGSGHTALTDLTGNLYFSQYNLAEDETLFVGTPDTALSAAIGLEIGYSVGVAPTLTLPTATSASTTSLSGTVTTDKDTGTLYTYVSKSGTPPSTPDHIDGTGADYHDDQAVSAIGIQTISPNMTGLTAGQNYYVHYLHVGVAESNQASTLAVQTASLVAEVTIVDAVNLTGLAYKVFSGYDLGSSTQITSGNDETTSATGVFNVNVDGLGVVETDPVIVVFGDWTVTPSAASLASVAYTTVTVE